MQCSKREFLTAIRGWRDAACVVHLYTEEISGALVAKLQFVSEQGVLEFSSHPLFKPLTVNLSEADEFEFVLAEREVSGTDSELVARVADEICLARVAGKLVFSMTRLIDPFADILAKLPSKPGPKSGAASAEPPVESDES